LWTLVAIEIAQSIAKAVGQDLDWQFAKTICESPNTERILKQTAILGRELPKYSWETPLIQADSLVEFSALNDGVSKLVVGTKPTTGTGSVANATVVHAAETSWSINSVWTFISSQARLLIYGVRKDAHTLLKIIDKNTFTGRAISHFGAGGRIRLICAFCGC
jgi:hypothetical protein